MNYLFQKKLSLIFSMYAIWWYWSNYDLTTKWNNFMCCKLPHISRNIILSRFLWFLCDNISINQSPFNFYRRNCCQDFVRVHTKYIKAITVSWTTVKILILLLSHNNTHALTHFLKKIFYNWLLGYYSTTVAVPNMNGQQIRRPSKVLDDLPQTSTQVSPCVDKPTQGFALRGPLASVLCNYLVKSYSTTWFHDFIWL